MNDKLTPVWVNIREEPFPEAAALKKFGSEWDLCLSPGRTICNPYYRCYLVRSYVLSPDRETLLNEEAGVLGMAMTEIGDDYLKMLQASIAKANEPKTD
ncbi:MAG TPA: hypothetical protein VFF73_29550 [Planctomycetota bacterium]|nr:hypothetical protein [Planctomycetota bacterium]